MAIGCALLPRRRLADTNNEEIVESENHLLNVNANATTACDAQLAAIDAALVTDVRPHVSASCRALLDAPRSVQCAYITTDCDIKYFYVPHRHVSHYRPPVIAKFNATGITKFCTSTGNVTFWAETNFFLGHVQFDMRLLQSSNNSSSNSSSVLLRKHVEWSKPYRLHMGVLQPGLYELRALSENDPLQNKTTTFVVENC